MKNKVKLAVILFLLAIFLVRSSFSLFRDSYAGKTSMASATWDVTLEQNGVNDDLTVISGISNANYTLNVKSLSDVDVKYDVILSNLPSGIEASIDGTNFTLASNGIVAFTNVGVIPYNATNNGVDTKTITLRGTNGATAVNNHVVTVDVVVKQVVDD